MMDNLKEIWAERYRVPVISDLSTSYYFVAAFAILPEDHYFHEILKPLVPSEEDAKLLGEYIRFRNERWLRPSYIQKMAEAGPVDIDPGVNTTIFIKTESGWKYRQASWTQGPILVPAHDSSLRFETLMELLDHERSMGGEPSASWLKFKLDNSLAI